MEKKGKYEWLMRGCWNLFALKKFEKAEVLELGCGDGFNSFYFYKDCFRLLGCDISSKAIKTARRRYAHSNIDYVVADFKESMPQGDYTNIIWDASMNFFEIETISFLLKEISERLEKKGGILSGTAVAKKNIDQKLKWRKYSFLFDSEEELERLLKKYFENVCVYGINTKETVGDKHILYYASNSSIPFWHFS